MRSVQVIIASILTAKELRETTEEFAARLRDPRTAYQDLSRKLYEWLLQPLEGVLEQTQIDTVIFVPDSVLRLVPIGALHDGSRFAVQKYAIATVPELSMIGEQSTSRGQPSVLLAGLSEPGPAVHKIPAYLLAKLKCDRPSSTEADADANDLPVASRALWRRRGADATAGAGTRSEEELRKCFALPGVDKEIEILNRIVQGTSLLNESFTLDQFKQQVTEGEYRVVHVASHGFFGSRLDDTFVMTYDDLLTLDGLQSLLKSEKLRNQPIELLTLSACQTAEGDDRAPLGFAGAAFKARARSALGTLWPVADEAAAGMMRVFYQALGQAGGSKVKALQKAQLAVLEQKQYKHPFYWAPFILVGSWQ